MADALAPEERDLLHAIARAPDDDATRLVLADHWQQRGLATRGELVALQCAGAAEADALLARDGDGWRAPAVAAGIAVEDLVFARGFLPAVVVDSQACADPALRRGSPVVYRALSTTPGANKAVIAAIETSARGDGDRVVVKAPGERDPLARAHVAREIAVLARLSHAGVERLRGGAVTATGPACVVDVAGIDLAELAGRDGGLAEAVAVEVAHQLAVALVAAHAAGIVHARIRPAHVCAATTGVVTLVDFAEASCDLPVAAERLWGGMMGVPAHVAPEQLENESWDALPLATRRCADVYATCLLVAELIAGRLPFREERSMTGLIGAILLGDHVLPVLTPALRALLVRGLAVDWRARPSLDELVAELAGLAAPAEQRARAELAAMARR